LDVRRWRRISPLLRQRRRRRLHPAQSEQCRHSVDATRRSSRPCEAIYRARVSNIE
jgi:hypothetical protein